MKVSITIDLNKLRKERIEERTYTNKDGEEVTVREYKLDVVPLTPEKKQVIKEGVTQDGKPWTMVKTHFVVNSPTQEERKNQTNTGYVGEGIMFEDKGTVSNEKSVNPDEDKEEIPF